MTRSSVAAWLPAVLVGVIAFSAARIAMLPGLGYWDTAELQTVAPILGTAHPTGFPTYVLLGWLANVLLTPFGEPALRMNLFAALSVAVAAAVTVDLVRALTRSIPLGMMAGIGLGLTGIVWDIGTHAEAHALHLAFVAILIRLLVAWEDGRRDRSLVAAAVVFGPSGMSSREVSAICRMMPVWRLRLKPVSSTATLYSPGGSAVNV